MKNLRTIVTEIKITPENGGESLKVESLKEADRNDVMRAAEEAARFLSGGFYRDAFARMTLMSWPGCQSPVKKITETVSVRVSTTFGNNNDNDPLVLKGSFVSQQIEKI